MALFDPQAGAPSRFRQFSPMQRFWTYSGLAGGGILILQLPAYLARQAHLTAAAATTGPLATVLGEGLVLSWVAAVTALLAIWERRPWGTFGLPLRRAFGRDFWAGTVWGFAGMTLLLGLIALNGDFNFGALALHGAAIARYAAEWGLAFLLVGLFEESCFRGYPLVTLAEGAGFWPAAAVLSVLFGALHLGNRGEDWTGALSAGLIGLFFCFTFRRTGDLWFAVGLHTSWDWCESFLYGVPDSGTVSTGRLLVPAFHGSRWITGGSVGPEGSVWVLVVVGLLFAAFARWYPQAAVTPFALRPKRPSNASSAA